MNVINDYGNRKIWNNPWIKSPYNIGSQIAPTNWVRTWADWNYNPNPMNLGWYSGSNIQSNRNNNYRSSYQPQYYTGRYAYRGWYPTYNYQNSWYGNYTYNPNMNVNANPTYNGDYKQLYYRMAADKSAWYNTPDADVRQLANIIKNNPEARQWYNSVKKGKANLPIDYNIDYRDQYGNYQRYNPEDPNNPQIVSRQLARKRKSFNS